MIILLIHFYKTKSILNHFINFVQYLKISFDLIDLMYDTQLRVRAVRRRILPFDLIIELV